jgi:phenylalanyl-tRNA synthetase beta chain
MNNGIKPLNNLLDTLNIITLLTNIPSAAYDASNISDIEVNFANKNENFSGFDGKEYKLDGKDIVVKTNNNIISIAGILGAKNFGTNKNSKDVYIEFANFNFVNLRNSANKYDIHTDAVRRNIHINTNYEILLAASLLQKYFAKNLIGYKLDVEIEKKKNIKINSKKINEIIGSNFKMNEIIEHLQKLGFGYNAQTKSVTPPLYRTDVTSIADISEEIIKSFDINKINEEPIKNSYSTINKHTEYYFIKKM